jgi:hypothetical protein
MLCSIMPMCDTRPCTPREVSIDGMMQCRSVVLSIEIAMLGEIAGPVGCGLLAQN